MIILSVSLEHTIDARDHVKTQSGCIRIHRLQGTCNDHTCSLGMSGRLPITYGRLGKKRAETSNRRASLDSPSSPGTSPSRPQGSSKLCNNALATSSAKNQRGHSDSPDPMLLVSESPSRVGKQRTPRHSSISKIVTVNSPVEAIPVTPGKRKRTSSQGQISLDVGGELPSAKRPKRTVKPPGMSIYTRIIPLSQFLIEF
jgi:hypothetical protein